MKTLMFSIAVIFCLFSALVGLPYQIICHLMGMGNPVPRWRTVLRFEYNTWRGIKAVKSNVVVEDGYMYNKITFEDSSFVLLRD